METNEKKNDEEANETLYKIMTIIFVGCLLVMIVIGWQIQSKGQSSNIIALEKMNKYNPKPPHLRQ